MNKVYYQPEIKAVFEECMEQITMSMPPTADQKCFHCGLISRHPIIAKERDLQTFSKLMEAAQKVLDRNGVAAHLLSEIRAEIVVSQAKKKARGNT